MGTAVGSQRLINQRGRRRSEVKPPFAFSFHSRCRRLGEMRDHFWIFAQRTSSPPFHSLSSDGAFVRLSRFHRCKEKVFFSRPAAEAAAAAKDRTKSKKRKLFSSAQSRWQRLTHSRKINPFLSIPSRSVVTRWKAASFPSVLERNTVINLFFG